MQNAKFQKHDYKRLWIWKSVGKTVGIIKINEKTVKCEKMTRDVLRSKRITEEIFKLLKKGGKNHWTKKNFQKVKHEKIFPKCFLCLVIK